jgi:serine protease Do
MSGPPTNGPTGKLLAGGAIKIRIALASVLVLVVGAWLTPRAAQTGITTSEERAAPLLEEQAQLTEASRTFIGVQDVAAEARQHTAGIPSPAFSIATSRNDFSAPSSAAPLLAGFGVFVSDGYVLTHSAALDGRSSVQLGLGAGDVPMEAAVVAYEPLTGLVLLQTTRSGRTPATLAADAPPAGTLAVGVGRSNGADIAVPVFVTRVSGDQYTIGAINDAILPGMPVFTLAGELFAVAAPVGRELRAIPVREAADRLMARASSGERPSSFGIGVQALAGRLTSSFGEQGVVVTEVLDGGPADLADIAVGDVLLAVGAAQIDSTESAIRELSSADVGTPTRVRLRRAGRVREVEVMPALAYEIATLARARGAPSGVEARVVFTRAALDALAIPPSARVLMVNGRAVTSRAQAQRELRLARAPVPVLLQQGDSRFFIIIEPTR